ncbi:MAG: hypothetical protein Q9218_003776 [Villophora microphyllina]
MTRFSFRELDDFTTYPHWASRMKMALMSEELWGYVTEKNKAPSAYTITDLDDSDEESEAEQRQQEIIAWRDNEKRCADMIKMKCSESTLASVFSNTSSKVTEKRKPKEIWDLLEQGWLREKGKRATKWSLIQRLQKLELKSTKKKDVGAWKAECMKLMYQFRDHEVSAEDILVVFMLGNLPPELDLVKKIILYGIPTENKSMPKVADVAERIQKDVLWENKARRRN